MKNGLVPDCVKDWLLKVRPRESTHTSLPIAMVAFLKTVLSVIYSFKWPLRRLGPYRFSMKVVNKWKQMLGNNLEEVKEGRQ